MFFTGRFDASALHIAHALKQTEIQKSYNKAREKPIDEYLVCLYLLLLRNESLSLDEVSISFPRVSRFSVSLIKMGSSNRELNNWQ